MHVSLVTMPYKDPEKRREFEKRWREKNRETLRAKQRERKRVPDLCVRDLRVVLTPLTRDECQVSLERLQRRREAVARDVECRACAERAREKEAAKRRKREQNRAWKKANREKVREYKRKWRENNREKVREQKRQWRKKVREGEQESSYREKQRVQKGKWRENNREKEREQRRKRERGPSYQEKRREQKRKWRENNREKDREQQRRRRQANLEKTREQQQTWYQNNRERVMEQKRQWRKDNPEKVRAQRKRRRERLRNDEARMRVFREKRRQQGQRWRRKHPENAEKARARAKEWRKRNPEKRKAVRERHREADNACSRRYHAAHREERNRATRERYYKKRGRPVPAPPSPCDCGLCLACGGWGVSWKPAWYARLNAFCTPQDPSTPAPTLEELPMDLPESEAEAETLSLASTSEIESELGDRLDSLLMDESDSEVETRDKVEAPTRRSKRIAALPSVSYKDWDEEEKLISEFLKRKEQLHAEGVDRIVTCWELLEHRSERVDAIVEEMSMGMDPTHQLDRFHHQLERQDIAMEVMVSEDLLDLVDAQLA